MRRAGCGGPGGLGRPGSRGRPECVPPGTGRTPGLSAPRRWRAVAGRAKGDRAQLRSPGPPERFPDTRGRNGAAPPDLAPRILQLSNNPGKPPSPRRAPPPNAPQVSGHGWDPGPAACAEPEANYGLSALGHPARASRHRAPGPNCHAGAAASNAVVWMARTFGAPPRRGDQGPPRGLAASPCLPFCVGSRLGPKPVLEVRFGGSSRRGALREHTG